MISALAPVVDNASLSYFYNQFNASVPENASASGEGPVFPSYIRTASMIICIMIMIIGVVGNVMVPLVILKSKDMRNSTNIFLINLSLADLLVLLVCTPTVLVEVNSRPETWVLGQEMCKAVPFVELTVAHASVLTILAISFERYYAICEPLKAGYVCTKTRAFIICLLAWTFAAIFTSPILGVAEYRYEEYFDGSFVPVCLTQADTFWPASFFIVTISIFFLLPLVVLIILYTVIAKHLMSHPGILGCSRRDASAKYRKQVVLMLGTVVVSFFLCLLPFRALTLWIIIVPPETVMSLGIDAYYNLLYFCRIMLYLNSAVNPILYNLMSSKFRDGFMRLCGVKRPGGERILGRNGTFHTTSTTTTSGGFQTRTSQDSFWRRSIISSKGATPAGSIKMILRHGTVESRNGRLLGEVPVRPKILVDSVSNGQLSLTDLSTSDFCKASLICDMQRNNVITSTLMGNGSAKSPTMTSKRNDESFV